MKKVRPIYRKGKTNIYISLIEINQLTCAVNHCTGFYLMRKLAPDGLITKSIIQFSILKILALS